MLGGPLLLAAREPAAEHPMRLFAAIAPHVGSVRESLSVLPLHGLPQSSSAPRLTPGPSGLLTLPPGWRAPARDLPGALRGFSSRIPSDQQRNLIAGLERHATRRLAFGSGGKNDPADTRSTLIM